METKFKGIDSEAHPDVAAEVSRIVKHKVQSILGNELSDDQMLVLNLCLSKKYGGNAKKIKADVLECCGVR